MSSRRTPVYIGDTFSSSGTGIYEPVITAATPDPTLKYWRGDKSWQTLNQAVVAGLTTADGPTFNHLHLTTDLPVTEGGTGASTFTDGGLLVGAAAGAIEALAAGATTQILVGGGAGTNPAWGTDIPTAVTIGSAYVYRASGTDVPVADGGTGASTLTQNGVLYGNAANAVGITAEGATGTYLKGTTGNVPAWADLALAVASGLTDGYVPYRKADTDILANSPIYTDGTNVGFGTALPLVSVQFNGAFSPLSGLTNASARPAVGTARIAGEIAGIGGAGLLAADDGFLRLSAGGGTAASVKSFIDISGYSGVADMNENIIFGTVGTEWMRLNASGYFGVNTNAPGTPFDVNGISTFRSHLYPYVGYTDNIGLINRKFLALHAAELWVETLVAQETIATIGGRILVAPTTMLTSDLSDSATTFYVKHNQLDSGDTIYMEASGHVEFMLVGSYPIGAVDIPNGRFAFAGDYTAIFTAGRKFTIRDSTGNDGEWTVDASTYDSGPGNTYVYTTVAPSDATADGYVAYCDSSPYAYVVTRNLDGSGANDWYAGDAMLNTGTTGDGFIDIYSVRGMKAGTEYGPTIVGNVRTHTDYADWEPRWAIGNLNGLYGYGADTYGTAFGSPSASWIKIDPTNGVRIGNNTTTKIQLAANGDASFSGTVTATLGYIGGWTIGATSLMDAAGAVGMSSAATGADDIRFWAGHATPASAPFKVTEAGALHATSATITGVVTANTGYIGGAGGWTIAANTISATNAKIWSDGTQGYIYFGADASPVYGDVGVWLGTVAAVPKFSIYASATNYLTFDGTNLALVTPFCSITNTGIKVLPKTGGTFDYSHGYIFDTGSTTYFTGMIGGGKTDVQLVSYIDPTDGINDIATVSIYADAGGTNSALIEVVGSKAGAGYGYINFEAKTKFTFTGGNVGIGTTVPGAGVEVLTDGGVTNALHLSSSGAYSTTPDASVNFKIKYNSAGTYKVMSAIAGGKVNATDADTRGKIEFYTRSSADAFAVRAKIDDAGDFYTNDGSVHSLSDKRLKDRVSDFKSGLKEIIALTPAMYKHKKETNKPDGEAIGPMSDAVFVGLEAQDVRVLIPEAVKEVGDGYLGMTTGPIVYALINAVKELTKRIAKLETSH